MAGLLDAFDDPQLRFGLGLLAAAGPRADGAGFGQRLMEGVGSVDAWKKQKALEKEQDMRQKMLDMQMQEAQRTIDDNNWMRDTAQKFYKPAGVETTMQPVNRPGDTGPNLFSQSASNMVAPVQTQTPGGFDVNGFAGEYMKRNPLAASAWLKEMSKKDLKELAPGASLYNAGTGKVEFTAPDKTKENEFIGLLRQYGVDPNSPQGKQLLGAYITKMATHQSPVSVSYGAPVAGVDANGNPVFFQPSKDGSAPQIIPGVKPNDKDAKPTEDQAKAAGWLAQAENAFTNMQKAKKESSAASSPGVPDIVAGVPIIGDPAANAMRSSARQKYIQASSAFVEAALRAATGAGMNEYEAKQKIKQFTPTFMESDASIAQKEADMKVFLDAVRIRAGKAAQHTNASASSESDPFGIRKKP